MKEGLSRLFWIILSVGALSYFIGDIVVAYQRLIVKDFYTFVDPSVLFLLYFFLVSFTFAFLYEIIYNRDLLENFLCYVIFVSSLQPNLL